MDKFIHIMQENNIRVEDIEKVKAIVIPMCAQGVDPEKMVTEEDFPWNAPYLIACAAYKINIARWYEAEIRKNTKIREFMKKVEIEAVDLGTETGSVGKELLFFTVTGAEIQIKGKTFREVGNCKNGVCEIKEMKDEEIIEKFININNVARVLPSGTAKKVVNTVLDLEKMQDITKLIKMITI